MQIKTRKRYTTETIIDEFKKIHEDKYDYSKVIYKTMHIKIEIVCNIHGSFYMLPSAHQKRKQGCSKCAAIKNKNRQKDTTETFLEKVKKIHGNRYDYSKTIYGNNAHEKVDIICRQHGLFKITPNSLLSAKANCTKCSNITLGRKLRKNYTIGWSKEAWTLKNKDTLCTFYIIKCWNETEEFYKLGITGKTVEERYKKSGYLPYNWKIIKIVQNTADYIYDLEEKILRITENYRYKPLIYFKGITKCRNLNFNYAQVH